MNHIPDSSKNNFGAPTGPRKELTAQSQNRDHENETNDAERKVKTKLQSMWNNMKYGWTVKLKTNFSKDSPVWLLGKYYHRRGDVVSSGSGLSRSDPGLQDFLVTDDEGIEGFKMDFITRIWFTYRREFPLLNGSTFTTDCGWGCMLRSGQMLMAQALICHFLGRGWRWLDQEINNAKLHREDRYHRMIIKWFGDNDSCNNPLSIHKLVALGESTGKRAGDWYGPASVAHLLRQAVDVATNTNVEFQQLTVYVAQDCTVYIQDVLDRCLDTSLPTQWKSLILLVPVRLGAEKINSVYNPCVTSLLTLEQCIGIIGGRPKHSLYFVGFQDDKLIHLDPHYCQQVVDVWEPQFSLGSFHCRSPRKMSLSRMDPSCCIGFYLKTREEFDEFCQLVQRHLVPPHDKGGDYPMFEFSQGSGRDVMNTSTFSQAGSLSAMTASTFSMGSGRSSMAVSMLSQDLMSASIPEERVFPYEEYDLVPDYQPESEEFELL